MQHYDFWEEAVPTLRENLDTIRTDGTGDGSGGSELQMYVEPESYSGSTDFDRQWEYAFDIKYGEKAFPVPHSRFSPKYSIPKRAQKLTMLR